MRQFGRNAVGVAKSAPNNSSESVSVGVICGAHDILPGFEVGKFFVPDQTPR